MLTTAYVASEGLVAVTLGRANPSKSVSVTPGVPVCAVPVEAPPAFYQEIVTVGFAPVGVALKYFVCALNV
jgi:hypothetical protein